MTEEFSGAVKCKDVNGKKVLTARASIIRVFFETEISALS